MTPRTRRRKPRRPPPGTAPDTLQSVLDASKPVVRAMCYDAAGVEEHKDLSPADVRALPGKRASCWIDVAGLGDPAVIASIGDALGLHKLALEDVLHVDQRPKAEEYDRSVYVVVRMIGPGHGLEGEQLSLFLGKDFVATFQEDASDGDCLEPVRERIRKEGSRLREGGPAYLLYALLDAITDAYFPVVEGIGDRLEALEERLLVAPEPAALPDLHSLRRDLLMLRRTLWPLRDVLGALLRDEGNRFDAALHPYFRDCHDHALRLIDLLETYRDLAGGLLELYLSQASHRLGEVTKVLTLVATIFIPLSFIAGVWGMNFDTRYPLNMPELEWAWGYPFALAVMAIVAIAMLLFFKRKGWL